MSYIFLLRSCPTLYIWKISLWSPFNPNEGDEGKRYEKIKISDIYLFDPSPSLKRESRERDMKNMKSRYVPGGEEQVGRRTKKKKKENKHEIEKEFRGVNRREGEQETEPT
jgi:hypothetical protein